MSSSSNQQLRAALADARSRVARSTGEGLRALLSPSPTTGVLSRFRTSPPPFPSSLHPPGSSSASTQASSVADPLGFGGLAATSLVGSGGAAQGESLFSSGGGLGRDIFVTTSEVLSKLCLGAVNGGVKFCTLGVEQCSYSTHSKKVLVQPDHVYILAGPKAAYSNHFIPVDKFLPDQLQQFLGETRSLEEWIQLFNTINARPVGRTIHSVATPAKKRKHRYLTESDTTVDLASDLQDLLDLLNAWKVESDEFESLPSSESYQKLGSFVAAAIQKLLAQYESLALHVGEDMDDAVDRLSFMGASIGVRPQTLSDECLLSGPTIWDGLLALQYSVEQMQQQNDISCTKAAELGTIINTCHAAQVRSDASLQHLHQHYDTLSTQLQDVSSLAQLLNQEHQDLMSALNHVDFSSLSSSALPISDIQSKLSTLESTILTLTQMSSNTTHSPDAILTRLRTLEAQVGVNPVRIGNLIFNSLEDTKVFVETHASGLSFSLFHDAVTLLESLTDVYVERQELILEWYQASRVGLSEVEAKHVASFKLILPSVLGITKEDKPSTSHPLNAVRSFHVWNPQNNYDGVK